MQICLKNLIKINVNRVWCCRPFPRNIVPSASVSRGCVHTRGAVSKSLKGHLDVEGGGQIAIAGRVPARLQVAPSFIIHIFPTDGAMCHRYITTKTSGRLPRPKCAP